MNRRTFLSSTGLTALGALLPDLGVAQGSRVPTESFEWSTPELIFAYEVSEQKLRQKAVFPRHMSLGQSPKTISSGVETAIQCSGENSPDPGMKQGVGQPGARLVFKGKHEEPTAKGRRLILSHADPVLGILVDSYYEAFDGIPVVRRWTRVTNSGSRPVGIEYVSSAMLHSLAAPQDFEGELFIHLAYNSWMGEAQWHSLRPSELGFVENGRTSWSEASAGSIGSWSTEKYLPMAMVENTRMGVMWFWQVEHNGSWYWEISNSSMRGINADDVYAYIGGPDDLHSAAWKGLRPGETYQTIPVALGCLQGGFSDVVAAFTQYRRATCERADRNNLRCPVIFNDYMNCLWGDPTEEKELPLIAAAAKAGCEYFVIDAGWYADLHEDWSQTIGAWEPSASRWPQGLKFVLDRIRQAGMIPGLWLEPEVAGAKSQLAQKPDHWFLVRHGKRVLKNSRYLLDFRNPEVRAYLDRVIARLVSDYGIGYIKMDYNVDSLQGTELNADSFGQGLLEHNRAHLAWLDGLVERYPDLTIENCGSGGGRMDYAMLSRLHIQSMTDQENYLKLPAILVGASAAVLPEQLAIWSYPLANADADQASFNMVTTMLCRIHQSGRLDAISAIGLLQVTNGIRVYKEAIREHIPQAVPFYPLGMPHIANGEAPIALGMKARGWTALAVWRLKGTDMIELSVEAAKVEILYPVDLGIEARAAGSKVTIRFPRPKMACVLRVWS